MAHPKKFICRCETITFFCEMTYVAKFPHIKGQKNLKSNYGSLNSSKKRTKNEKNLTWWHVGQIFLYFRLFFGRNWGHQKLLLRFSDLYDRRDLSGVMLVSFIKGPQERSSGKLFFLSPLLMFFSSSSWFTIPFCHLFQLKVCLI